MPTIAVKLDHHTFDAPRMAYIAYETYTIEGRLHWNITSATWEDPPHEQVPIYITLENADRIGDSIAALHYEEQ